MKYGIRHTETLVGFYEVEADTEEEALDKFEAMCWEGTEIDLSDLAMLDSSNEIYYKRN